MTPNGARLKIIFITIKIFKYLFQSDPREQFRQRKVPLCVGSEGREAVGHQPLMGTVGPV